MPPVRVRTAPTRRTRGTVGRVSLVVVMAAASLLLPPTATAQEAGSERDIHWLPGRDLLPTPTTGPRDPVSKAELLYVSKNPTQFGAGMEAEFALAALFPLLRWGEAESAQVGRQDWVVGVEAAAFARFGDLEILNWETLASGYAAV